MQSKNNTASTKPATPTVRRASMNLHIYQNSGSKSARSKTRSRHGFLPLHSTTCPRNAASVTNSSGARCNGTFQRTQKPRHSPWNPAFQRTPSQEWIQANPQGTQWRLTKFVENGTLNHHKNIVPATESTLCNTPQICKSHCHWHH